MLIVYLMGINSKKRTLVVDLAVDGLSHREEELVDYRCTDKVWRYINGWGKKKGQRFVQLCLEGDGETVYHLQEVDQKKTWHQIFN